MLLVLTQVFCIHALFGQKPTIAVESAYRATSSDIKPDIYKDKNHHKLKTTSDSVWYFNPFGVSLSPGISFPLGKFSEYVNPSFGFGFSFNLHVWKALSIEAGMLFRFLDNKKSVFIRYNDSLIECQTPLAVSIGGWIHRKIYKNHIVYTELIAGMSLEELSTDYIANTPDDSLVSLSTFGYALGLQNYFNCLGAQNIAIKLLYQNAFYNRNNMLVTEIGGHSISLALVYRFPPREPFYKKYYWLME
ncbi:MAG: hypothetical protein JNK73_06030 [Bacteroidia bacterium]|nr:hypothetical protein [Bacteroidia bacterium]